MPKANPTLLTIKKIENAFQSYDAISKSFLENKLGLGYYAIKEGIRYLQTEGKIKPIKSSSKGVLYAKC